MVDICGVHVKKTYLRCLLLVTVPIIAYVLFLLGPVVLREHASLVRQTNIHAEIRELKAKHYLNIAELNECLLGIILFNTLVAVFCAPNYMYAEPAWLVVMYVPSMIACAIGAFVYYGMAYMTWRQIHAILSVTPLSAEQYLLLSKL